MKPVYCTKQYLIYCAQLYSEYDGIGQIEDLQYGENI